jgi:hypothetical protein
MPTVSPQISGNFCLFPRSTAVFIELKYDLEKKHKNLKAITGSSPIFALSNYTTFNQTQTGATVPLKTFTFFAPF